MPAGDTLHLDQMLTQATQQRASDLHIRVGMPPMLRVDGSVRPLEGYDPVTKEQATMLVAKSTSDEQKKNFYENKSLDFSRAVADVARFRCAYFLQQGLMSMVYRRIPDKIPTLAELKAPSVLLDFARAPRGLVLVTGPTGSGKSTTLAAVLDVINSERADHILTIEDPIEFVHKPKRCVVNQREIGRDAPNFAHALRGALRQDPDIILVGEMRDLETIATAITAAETGHLVFGTLHTSTAPSTIDRVIDQYPADQQQQIRVMLSSSLIGIVTQALLPRADGPGRVAVHEVLVANNAVRALIRHQQMDQVRGVMQTQTKLGMQTMDRALAYYVHTGALAEDLARDRAINVGEFEQTLRSFRSGQNVAIPQIVQPTQGSMLPGIASSPGGVGGGSMIMPRPGPAPGAGPGPGAFAPNASSPPPSSHPAGASQPGAPASPGPVSMGGAPTSMGGEPDSPMVSPAQAAQAAHAADAALRAARAQQEGNATTPPSAPSTPSPKKDAKKKGPEKHSRFSHLFSNDDWQDEENAS